jgi:hypothetical protein
MQLVVSKTVFMNDKLRKLTGSGCGLFEGTVTVRGTEEKGARSLDKDIRQSLN